MFNLKHRFLMQPLGVRSVRVKYYCSLTYLFHVPVPFGQFIYRLAKDCTTLTAIILATSWARCWKHFTVVEPNRSKPQTSSFNIIKTFLFVTLGHLHHVSFSQTPQLCSLIDKTTIMHLCISVPMRNTYNSVFIAAALHSLP